MNEQYHITPAQVSGDFTVTRVTDHPEDDYAYLFIEGEGLHERCIIYNYPPEAAGPVRQMQPPARCRFAEGYLIVLEQAGEPTQRQPDV